MSAATPPTPAVLPDPQDARDLTEREIDELADELSRAASNHEWLLALDDGIARMFGWRADRADTYMIKRLRAFRAAVESRDSATVTAYLRTALDLEWRTRAEEKL